MKIGKSSYKTFINGYKLYEATIYRKDIAPSSIPIVARSIKEALAIAGEYCSDYLMDVHVICKNQWVLLQKN